MAKKSSKKVIEYEGIDAALSFIVEDAKSQFGEDRIFTGKESEARLVGLYLPALSLRYLYQCNIKPLSRMEQITGTQESCKSAFLYEHYRWIRCHKGRSYHIENESKDSDALRLSIMNYDYDAVTLLISESLDDWQKILTYLTGEGTIKKALLSGPGKAFPVGFAVDSLTAKASLEVQQNVDKLGYADRAHPVDALKINTYLKCMPQRLVGWPFWFGAINHLKPQKNSMGATDYHTPGGYSVKFQETFETRLQRTGDINTATNGGAMIKLTTQKNSLGPGRKSINAGFKWYHDDEGKQHSYWDWDTATIELLTLQLSGGIKNKCSDIVDLHVSSGGGKGKLVHSNVLGISKDDAVPMRTAGKMLEQRKDLIDALHKVLGIHEYSVFREGIDYEQQLRDARVVVEKEGGYDMQVLDGERDAEEVSKEALASIGDE